jgi:cytochrome c oxidase subunit IV
VVHGDNCYRHVAHIMGEFTLESGSFCDIFHISSSLTYFMRYFGTNCFMTHACLFVFLRTKCVIVIVLLFSFLLAYQLSY